MKRHQPTGDGGHDDLLGGLGSVIAVGLVGGALVCVIIFGMKILMVIGALMFFGWAARWLIRIF